MKTVGEVLSQARLERRLSLDQIAVLTKIPIKYLISIEKNDYINLPSAAFTKGIVRTLATVLEINPDQLLAMFRRDYDADERGRLILRGLVRPVQPLVLPLSLHKKAVILSITIIVVFLGWWLVNTSQLMVQTKLEVFEPADGAVLTSPVTIRGKSDETAKVLINNQESQIKAGGDFGVQIPFNEGEHTVVVVANKQGGRKKVIERKITVVNIEK